MNTKKLNESYSVITSDKQQINKLFNVLRVEKPGALFDQAVQRGFKSPYQFFGTKHSDTELIVMNGHTSILSSYGVDIITSESDYNENDLNSFLDDIRQHLPFTPHDFQEAAFNDSILNSKQINLMATSSGKSLTISLIAEFFRRQNKRGLLLVPNINLLTQFKGDIKEYLLDDLYNDCHVIGGGSTERHFNNSLTISTWQSLMNYKEDLDKLDYVLVDEVHRFASDETSAIVSGTLNCKYKFGFTGTMPDDPVQKMMLIGLFGIPKRYITSKGLIDRGLATPIKINTIIFNYSNNDKQLFKYAGDYAKKLKFIKEHENRNEVVTNLAIKVKQTGNTLVLAQHLEHMKLLFITIMNKLHPDVIIENKDITGKNSFDFQEKYGIYYISGSDDAKTREKTRKILEEHSNAILISGYQLLSTGVSIKRLHNMIFAGPTKAYTTITQSIGRLMRLHKDKKEANIYDLVDNFGAVKPGGIFYKQYQHRCTTSYFPEEYPIKEVHFDLFK